MAVDSVNNVNNNMLYAGGATLAGGVAGGAVGYYTKSFLKDGEPTDTFIKKVGDNMVKLIPPELAEEWSNLDFKDVKSMEDVKANNMKLIENICSKLSLGEAKQAMVLSIPAAVANGEIPMNVEEIDKAKSLDELLELAAKNMDANLAGKNFDELKEFMKLSKIEQVKGKVSELLTQMYDFDKKKFYSLKEIGFDDIDAGDVLGQFALKTRKALTDAASSIKGKAALIYGGITAAAAGAGTLLALNLRKPEEVLEPQE